MKSEKSKYVCNNTEIYLSFPDGGKTMRAETAGARGEAGALNGVWTDCNFMTTQAHAAKGGKASFDGILLSHQKGMKLCHLQRSGWI